ncbi:lipase family protein, partial [Streptococcus equi]
MMISDSSYKKLSEQVYNVEPSKAKSNDAPIVLKGNRLIDDKTGKQYRVLLVQDNNNDAHKINDNGMQAMAVAPIVQGDVDTSQVVIAYAGTNAADSRDLDTDWQLLIRGNQDDLVSGNLDGGNFVIAENQLRSAQKFYQQVKRKYPHSALTTTGHSLGAYLALIVAAEHKIPATTFNGPDPVR